MSPRIKIMRPLDVYRYIPGGRYRQIYVVGDIHGHLDDFHQELHRVGFNTALDLVISAGDLIDRGPRSLACLELTHQPWFTAVRGNHEDLASAALREGLIGRATNIWLGNGGDWILNLPDKVSVDRAKRLIQETEDWPYVMHVRTATQTVVIAHGCYPYPTYHYGKPINLTATTWDQTRLHNRIKGHGLTTEGADLFVHGHNGVPEPTQYGNHMYIDTHWMSGRLTLLRIQ